MSSGSSVLTNHEAQEDALDQAIAEFLRAEAAGQAGDRQQWLARYPDCATELAEFFDDHDRVDHLLVPVRQHGTTSVTQPLDIAPRGSADVETADPAPVPPRTARYRAVRFHSRGGMGEVWLAQDTTVGRQVALKKLRPGRTAERERFMLEARITGQLQHPSVVPLHDLGKDENGQPYYVMKFVQGRSLRAAIAHYHSRKSSAAWPRDLEFLRLLETFIGVCNALGYAHSKGVLHRDIKPDNVMLGPFGETVLLDWGLAKFVGQPDEPARSSIVNVGSGGSTATQDGAVIGTPVYISPEGAEGRPEAVDQRSDVYLLGSTLYEILTGRPPRRGSSQWQVIEDARQNPPPAPRKVDAQVPRPLEAICLKAMAFHKDDRYASPTALADDVQRYLAGEPLAAYDEPWADRLARWMRRRQRAIIRAVVVLLFLGVCSLAAFSFQRSQAVVRREQARQQLEQFYRLADEAQFFAASSDAIAERAPFYDPARALGIGREALKLAEAWGDAGERLPLDEDARAELCQARYHLLLVLSHAASCTDAEDRFGDALQFLEHASRIQPPSLAFSLLHRRLAEPAASASQPPIAGHWLQPTAHDHFIRGEVHRLGDTGSLSLDEEMLALHERREHLEQAAAEYRQALARDPKHYWARFQLGRCLIALGNLDQAVATLGGCVALRPDSPWAYSARGLAHALAGDRESALADLDHALDLDPNFAPARLNRGVAHWLAGDLPAAAADFDRALDAPPERRLVEAAYYRGRIRLSEDRPREALADLSVVIGERPKLSSARWFRAQAHIRLGDERAALDDLGQMLALRQASSEPVSDLAVGRALRSLAMEPAGEARLTAWHLAADALDRHIEHSPADVEAYLHRGAVEQDLAYAARNAGRTDEAEALLARAIAFYSQGVELAPQNAPLRKLRGWAYESRNQLAQSLADFTAAVRLAPDDAEARTGLGYVLARSGAADLARQEAAASLLLGEDDYRVLHNAACIYAQLSTGKEDERVEYENLALSLLKRAVALWQQRRTGPDARELIRMESAFPLTLRSRIEFARLISDAQTDSSKP